MKYKLLQLSLISMFVMLFGGLAQAADPEVTLDFSGATDWGIPTGGTNNDLASFTDGTYTIKLYSTTNYKQNTGYLILGKKDSYLELQAFDFDVEKIQVVGKSGASGKVTQNIYVGDVAVSTETTGANGVTNTYDIAAEYQDAGNIYKLVVTNAYNTQIESILIYKKATTPEPTASYYIVGSMTDWAVNDNYKMTLNGEADTEEYSFNMDLTTTDQFKVVKVLGESQTWYPDGMGNNYGENGEVIKDGNYDVYFRPNADGGDGWFYNYIYVAAHETPVAHDYYIVGAVGSPEVAEGADDVIFTKAWLPGVEENKMTKGDGNTYTWTKENVFLEKTTIYYKVTQDGTWDVSYGVGGSDNGDNITYAVTEPATYTVQFAFNTEDHTPQITLTKTADYEITGYNVAGSSTALFGGETAWDATANAMTLQDDGKTWKKTFENVALTAGDIEYKVAANGAWIISYPENNATLNIAADGNYDVEFTFNAETKAVAATAALHKTAYTATFTTNAGWEKVYAYVFADNAPIDNVEWPGKEITSTLAAGVYTYSAELTKAPTGIVFNNGNSGEGNQTEDFEFVNGKAYELMVAEPTWTIAGSAKLLFGDNWWFEEEESSVNNLEKGDGHVWTKTYTNKLLTGIVYYGVFKNHGTDEYYPTGLNPDNLEGTAQQLAVDGVGYYDVTFTFNDETHALSAEATKKSDYTITSVVVNGNSSELFNGDLALEETSAGVWTGTIEAKQLSAGTIQFGATVNNENVLSPYGSLTITEAGKYDVAFTYTVATNKITAEATVWVEQPETYAIVGELTGGWPEGEVVDAAVMTKQESGLYTYEVESFTAEAKTYAYKLRANNKYGVFDLPNEGNNEYTFNEAGNYKLTFTANVTGEAIGEVAAYTLTLVAEKIEAPQPELNTYTATFDNGGNWNMVFAYTWSGEDESKVEQLGNWPGKQIEKDGDVYKVTIKAEAAPEYIIFHDNAGVQTEDLVFENEKAYTYTAPVTTYAIVGDFTGGFPEADEVDAAVMTKQESGLYTYEIESFAAEAKAYEYKLRANNSWSGYQLPAEGNQSYTFKEAGNYKLTFTANVTDDMIMDEISGIPMEANTLTLAVEKIEEPQPEITLTGVFIKGGTGSEWTDPFEWELTANAEAETYVLAEKAVAANTEFKVYAKYSDENVKWLSPESNGKFLVTEELLGTELALAEENPNMYFDKAGTFTFTVKADMSALTISGEFAEEPGPEPTGDFAYSWESPEGTPIETGGTIAYVNGDGDRLNYLNSGYYTICLNGKKANLNDESASANAGHMEVTLDEPLCEGDVINITGYVTKKSSAQSSAYIFFADGVDAESETFGDAENIHENFSGAIATKDVAVPAEAVGLSSFKMTRGVTGTNLFITKLTITRAEQPEPVEPDAEITKVQLLGGWNWDAGVDNITLVKGDGNVWTGVLDLTDITGDQEFKLVVNGGGDESDGWKGWIGTNNLTVDAPENWVVATAEAANANCTLNNATTGYQTYTITATWTPSPDYAAGWTLKIEGKDVRPEVVLNDYTATFTTDVWDEVYAYVWSGEGENKLLGDWPGTKLEKNAETGLYDVAFQAEAAPEFIIFNNGNGGVGNQTADLEFVDGKAYSYEPVTGDANLDGEVTTGDAVAAVSYALGTVEPTVAQFKAADVNKNEVITVSDAVGIVNIALGEPEPTPGAKAFGYEANNYLTLKGQQVGLTNATEFVAFQMDVTLTDGALFNGVQLSQRAAGLQVVTNKVGENTWRIIAFSMDNSVITGSTGSLLTIDTNGEMTFSNIEFADADAQAYELTFDYTTGIDSIHNSQFTIDSDAPMYNTAGQRVGRNYKGVVIQNGKKYVIK